MSSDQLLSAAIQTVAHACRVARSVQQNLEHVRQITKDDRSPVTVADFAVQAIVALGLNEALGENLIVGEESAGTLRKPEQAAVRQAVVQAVRSYKPDATEDDVLDAIDHCDHDGTAEAYWALDPIDGTKGFLRGQQYAIALGRIERGQVVLGVMGCPNLPLAQTSPLDVADAVGTLYAAVRGSGAWEYADAEMPIAPRQIATARGDADQPIRTCESVEASHSRQDDTHRILAELGQAGPPVRLDSQCKYAVVARGQADAYLRLPTGKSYVEKIWDHAAGSLIATEAGAIVTDITGSPLDFTHGTKLGRNRGIVCAAPGLHPRIISAIERLGISALAS